MRVVDLEYVTQLHPFFWGNQVLFGIYAASLAVLFLFRKKLTRAYHMFFWYAIMTMVLVIYNPFFVSFAYEHLVIRDMSSLVRIFLMLPVYAIVACVLTEAISRTPKVIMALLVLGIVVLSVIFGTRPSDNQYYIVSSNPFKVNEQSVIICDAINADVNGCRYWVYIPKNISDIHGSDIITQGMRQYDSGSIIRTSFPMTVTEDECESGEFTNYLDSIQDPNYPTYIISLKDQFMKMALEKYGYYCIAETDDFYVMSNQSEKEGAWSGDAA